MSLFFQEKDPFYQSNEEIHIRLFHRNARKTITTLEGLNKDLNFKKLLDHLKRKFNCNGAIKENIISFSGDQRENLTKFLIEEGIANQDQIKIHGY